MLCHSVQMSAAVILRLLVSECAENVLRLSDGLLNRYAHICALQICLKTHTHQCIQHSYACAKIIAGH